MDLSQYVGALQRQLAAGAEGGGEEARALVERMAAPMDAAIRLALQDALSGAAEEITLELAPGSVDIRLRGRELEFVVTPPPAETAAAGPGEDDGPPPMPEDDEGAVARINLRLPDALKTRVEQAAGREGLSVNSWLVRAASAALDRGEAAGRRGARPPGGTQRYTGWAR